MECGFDSLFRHQEYKEQATKGADVRVLLAADGSKYTGRAVDYLIKHRAQFGDAPQLVLIHVRMPVPARAASALGRKTVDKYYDDEARKALAPARRKLDRAGVPYSQAVRIGDPGTEIAAHAGKGRFDMIIMGSHGHGMLTRLILGSCASKVMAQTKIPVLLIR
jgi:nucleotide-binding universal stress UspA family protein